MLFQLTLARLCLLLASFLSFPLQAQLALSEFLASNNSGLRDELDKVEDWVEIQNSGGAAVSLTGWYLTDDPALLNKWAFPAWTLGASNRLVVFASSRDRRPAQTTAGADNLGTIASPRLATNFKIGTGSGGFLALCKDQAGGGQVIVSQFSNYPKQSPDFSYGRGVGSGTPLFTAGQSGVMKYLIPSVSTPAEWNQLVFDDSSWTAASGTAIGFDSDYSGVTSFQSFYTVDLGSASVASPSIPASNPMYTKNSTIYTRYAFNVADKTALGGLTLKLRYEDGFVAWLNGVEIARGNFTATPAYNSTTAARTESLALLEEMFDVTSLGLPALVNGTNVLCIMGINGSAASNDFLLAPVLLGLSSANSNNFMMPSPGASNGTATTPTALAISAPSGLFTGTLSVTISGQQAGQIVRYTTDGAEPTMSVGATYTTPLSIGANTTLKARLFFENLGGPLVDANYILRGTTSQYGINPATFSSSLPILVIDSTDTAALTNIVANPARFSLFDRSVVDQRATLTATPAFTTRGTLNVRGQSSAGLAKKGYGIEFRNAAERDKNLGVLGMAPDSDWILYASYQYDTNFMRNVLMYDFYRRTGRWAPQTRFVEVFLNANGSSVDGADYLGVYVLLEKIKLDSGRINLEGVTPLDNTGDPLTGAYLFAHDKQEVGTPVDELLQTGTLANWNDSAQKFIVKEPNLVEITAQQRTYLTDLILKVDTALGAANFTHPTTGLHYREYIARDSFIDHHMFNAFAKNVDALRISAYFQKDRLGKIQMSSVWDFDRSMDSDTDVRDDNASYWNSDDAASSDFFSRDGRVAEGWFHRLHQDPDYMQEWVDRYDRWRTAGVLDSTAMATFLDQKATELTTLDNGGADTPIGRNFARWARTVRGTAVNQANAASVIFGTATTSELSRQKTWIQTRIPFMDTFVLAKPVLSVAPGIITSTTPISITSPDSSGGTLYYTLDGSDPRATGGGIATSARVYSSSITLPTSGFVTTRLRKSGLSPLTKHTDWSAPRQSYYIVGATPASSADLRISELMYHPADPSPAEITAGFTDSDQFEYIELLNVGSATINLYGATIVSGVDYNFSEALKPALLQMAPGARVLVVKNLAAFTFRHGAVAAARVIGEFDGNDNLNNSGETITINSASGFALLTLTYSDLAPWPAEADGLGSSLVLANRTTGANLSDSANWQLGATSGGTPGLGEIKVASTVPASSGLPFSGQLTPESFPSGITRTYTRISGPSWLAVSSTGALTGTPAVGNIGLNAFVVGVNEGAGVINVTVSFDVNATPAFGTNPIALNATEDAALAGQLSATDSNGADSLTYALVSAPTWLSVSSAGVLSGTPLNEHVGLNLFTVSVFDGKVTVEAVLNVTVANTNDAPVFAADPITASANAGTAFTGQLAATDADVGAVLSFSKQSGPAWLSVSPAGSLTGSPTNAEVGANSFVIEVTDGITPVTATLTITVTGTGSSLAGFTSTHFTAPEQADPLVSGPAADPDNDGISNLLEYALGMNPRLASAEGLPRSTLLEVAADTFISLSYTRIKGALDLTFIPEFSYTAGDSGFTASGFTQVSVQDQGNGTETVTVRDNTPISGTTPRFARIRVIQN